MKFHRRSVFDIESEYRCTRLDFFQAVCDALLEKFPELGDSSQIAGFYERKEQAQAEMARQR